MGERNKPCLYQGSDIKYHLPKLQELAEKCDIVVEFGVRSGESTRTLVKGVKQLLVSYDIKNCYIPEVDDFARERGVEWIFIVGNTAKVNIGKCDMLFIDSLHTYEHLKCELERHHEQVATYIAMHDTWTFADISEDRSRPGLQQAVTEFLQDNNMWEVHYVSEENNGLTVLKRIH